MTEHVLPPSRSGSVVLEMGGSIGALILHAPPDLEGLEIEISPAEHGVAARRTHSLVRKRVTAAGVNYAAVYVSVSAGTYTVWRDDGTAAGTVTVQGGDISHFSWGPTEPDAA